MGRLNGDGTATLPDGSTVKVITRGITGTYVRLFNMGNGTWLADVPSSGHVQADNPGENPYVVFVKSKYFLEGGTSTEEICIIDKLGNKFILPEKYWPPQSAIIQNAPYVFSATYTQVFAGFGGFVLLSYSRGNSYYPQIFSGPPSPFCAPVNCSIIHQFTLSQNEVIVADSDFEQFSFNLNGYIQVPQLETDLNFPSKLSITGSPECNSGKPSNVTAGVVVLESGVTDINLDLRILIRGRTQNNKLITDLSVVGLYFYSSSSAGQITSVNYTNEANSIKQFTAVANYELIDVGPFNASRYDYDYINTVLTPLDPPGPPATNLTPPGVYGQVPKILPDLGCGIEAIGGGLSFKSTYCTFSFILKDWTTSPTSLVYTENFENNFTQHNRTCILVSSNPDNAYYTYTSSYDYSTEGTVNFADAYSGIPVYTSEFNQFVAGGMSDYPIINIESTPILLKNTSGNSPIDTSVTRNKVAMGFDDPLSSLSVVLVQGESFLATLNAIFNYNIKLVVIGLDNTNLSYNIKKVYTLPSAYFYFGSPSFDLGNQYFLSFGVDYTR